MGKYDRLEERLEKIVRENEQGPDKPARRNRRTRTKDLPQLPGKPKDWLKKVTEERFNKRRRG